MSKALRVLVVEDHEVNQELMREMLDRFACVVDTAENGKEALEKVEASDYDVIFMDVQMPEMDGLEATRKIREHRGSKGKTPIVALTASAMQGDEKKCLDAGMDDYLSKPFELKDIESLLKKYFP